MLAGVCESCIAGVATALWIEHFSLFGGVYWATVVALQFVCEHGLPLVTSALADSYSAY